MELHPLCTLFPRLSGHEFDCLKVDIRENGLRTPITTYKGMILDGGNRYQACIEIGINPIFEEYVGNNLSSFVLTSNLHRRHLSPGQQAAIVACVQDWAKAHPPGNFERCNVAPFDKVSDRAAQSGASIRTQKTADKLAKAAPELAKQVARGEKTLPMAEKEAFPKIDTSSPDEPVYTELDAAHDQIAELQDRLAVNLMEATEDDKKSAETLISSLRAEIKTLTATLKAITANRDSLLIENAALKKQCLAQQRQLKKMVV